MKQKSTKENRLQSCLLNENDYRILLEIQHGLIQKCWSFPVTVSFWCSSK